MRRQRTTKRPEARELALKAAVIAADKKGTDVAVLQMSEVLVITDYFVIVGGTNRRQVKTIAEAIEEGISAVGVEPMGVEGEAQARWILLDYGDVVVHVFDEEERSYYQLERLWKDAPVIELPAEATTAD